MLFLLPIFAQQGPKNLKVLTPEDLRNGAMRNFTIALGQGCNFCHAQGDMSSDDKQQKLTARKMIVMTKEINAKFEDGKAHVTCYTCHRGTTEPLTAPAAN
jgi:photosynthetic reaction center cytochrome c subunit